MQGETMAIHGGRSVRTAPFPSTNDGSGRNIGEVELALRSSDSPSTSCTSNGTLGDRRRHPEGDDA